MIQADYDQQDPEEAFTALCAHFPDLVPQFRKRLVDGQIEGRWYFSDGCGCAIGTFFILKFGVPKKGSSSVDETVGHLLQTAGIFEHYLLVPNEGESGTSKTVSAADLIYAKLNIEVDDAAPIERFFSHIRRCHTPDNNEYAEAVLAWLDQWLENQQ